MANVKARIHLNKQLVAFNIDPKQTKQHSKYQQQPWRSNKNPKTNNKPAAFIPESVDVLFSFQRSPNTSLKYLFSPSNGNPHQKNIFPLRKYLTLSIFPQPPLHWKENLHPPKARKSTPPQKENSLTKYLPCDPKGIVSLTSQKLSSMSLSALLLKRDELLSPKSSLPNLPKALLPAVALSKSTQKKCPLPAALDASVN